MSKDGKFTPEQLEESISDLDYTQKMRKRIVTGIADSAIDSKDPETLRVLNQTLDGMDKASMGRLKINEKDKESTSRDNETEVLSRYLIALNEKRAAGDNDEPSGRSAVAGSRLPDGERPKLPETVLSPVASTETANQFLERMDTKKK